MNKASIKVQNLCTYIGKKKIIDDVTFELSGGITGLLGKNGAGKTTLIKTLAGIYKQTSGEIVFFDENKEQIRIKNRADRAKCVSYIPQNTENAPCVSAYEFALMGVSAQLPLFSKPTKKQQEFTKEAFRVLNISQLLQRRFDTLSGGEKKLCYLARLIASGCTTALLDETYASLDFEKQHDFFALLKKGFLKNVLLSIHEPNLVFSLCDRVLIMDKGRIVSDIYMNQEDSKERYIDALKKLYSQRITLSKDKDYILWTD